MLGWLAAQVSAHLATRSQRGASAVEYALIAALVGVGMIAVTQAFFEVLGALFRDTSGSMQSSP